MKQFPSLPRCEFETERRYPSGRRECTLHPDIKCGRTDPKECASRKAELARKEGA